MKIYKDFRFEAAHFLPDAPSGHPNSRVHGHSFRARVWVSGEPDPATGILVNFSELSDALSEARDTLDHNMLNEIEGLETPTLEHISIWLWNRVANRIAGVTRIEISRDSCNEGCVYDGPKDSLSGAAE